jgi:hypothetical protein
MAGIIENKMIRNWFLEPSNLENLGSQLYNHHVMSGGKMKKRAISSQMDRLAKSWIDGVFIWDFPEGTLAETIHDYANKSFVKYHLKLFVKSPMTYGEELIPTHTLDVNGYRSLDLHGGDESIIVENSQYRYNNKIPSYQHVGHLKWHAMDGEGRHAGRMVDGLEQKRYNMQSVSDYVDKPYFDFSDHIPEYYGVPYGGFEHQFHL